MITLLLSQNKIWLFNHPNRQELIEAGSMDLTQSANSDQLLQRIQDMGNGEPKEKVILIYPNDLERYSETITNIKASLADYSSTELFFATAIHYPLLWNCIEKPEDKIVLMEATEGQAHVFYYIPEAVQHRRLSSMVQVGEKEGTQNIVDKLIRDLGNLGLQVKSEELGEIYENILQENYESLRLEKTGDYSKVRAEFTVDEDLVRNSYERNNRHLTNYINSELVKKYSIRRIILVGSYFQKADSQVFLEKQCQGTGVQIESILDQNEILKNAAEGAGKMAFLKLDEQRKEMLEREKEMLEARKRLVQRIDEEVTDPDQRLMYLEKFKAAAEKDNVPFEIIKWHIENKIKDFELQNELTQVNNQLREERIPLQWETEANTSDIPNQEESDLEEEPIIIDDADETPHDVDEEDDIPPEAEDKASTDEEEYPIGSIQSSPEKEEIQDEALEQQLIEELEAFEVTDFSWPDNTEKTLQLENIIQTERIYPNSEFILLKGKIKGSKIDRIFRIISTNELDRIENLQKFRRLYERVSRYYDNVSKIFRSNFGLFYYRDYIEGVPLDRYIRQKGIDQKESLKELSSEDLKLIFHLWKEVKEMDFSYTSFQAHNIIVTKEMKWNLAEEISVKFTGIRSDVSSKEEMEDRLHEMLDELLYDGVYDAFKDKFI